MRKIMLENIGISYNNHRVLHDLSFTFEENEVYILTGASGKGKTTLLKILMGLITPDAGKVSLPKGFRVTAAFQEDRLLPELSAVENLLFALPRGCRKDRAEAERFLGEILPSEAFFKKPAELSGGMCRRVTVARALFAPSDAVVLDEPFAGLDDETAKQVSAFIKAYQDERMLIIATHRPEFAPPGIPIML